MVYSELQRVNKNLTKLNDTMKDAVTAIKEVERDTYSIAESLCDIERNTNNITNTNESIAKANETIAKNSAVIAHNTAVNAFYAKKNAELTDALGYMVAFN